MIAQSGRRGWGSWLGCSARHSTDCTLFGHRWHTLNSWRSRRRSSQPPPPSTPRWEFALVDALLYPAWIISYMSSERNSTHPIEFRTRLAKIEATAGVGETIATLASGWANELMVGDCKENSKKNREGVTWLWREKKEKGGTTDARSRLT
jgi:hypothetical protein